MALFQRAPSTQAELEANAPLALSPEEVLTLDEPAWYERVYRGEEAPQLTVRAVLMGSALGFFLAFANLYIGLKAGWHLSVAITASVLSFSIWSSFVKSGVANTPMTILETNCMQSTASSAGYATGGTLVSAFPALLMLSVTPDNPKGTHSSFWVLFLWTFAVGVLGVMLAIPMKRSMINHERLRFPSGTAAAVTLQGLYSAGAEASQKARTLLLSGLVAMTVPLLKDLNIVTTTDGAGKAVRDTLLPGQSKIFDFFGSIEMHGKSYLPSDFNLKLDHGIALVAAGAIVGLRMASFMMLGALILVFVVTPLGLGAAWENPQGQIVYAVTKPQSAWKELGLWIGAPMLVASGLTSFALNFGTIARAFRSFGGKQSEDDRTEALESRVRKTEVPLTWFIVGTVVTSIPLLWLGLTEYDIPLHLGALAVLLTFALSIVACRATGESDITPVGAMGKITQLTYGVLMPQSVSANLMTAAITAGSASASADLLNDLKSGYLLGANPRRQVIAQAAGALSGSIASVLGYYLLVPDATAITGIDGRDPAFAAPAAQQWKVVAELFRLGIGNMHPMTRKALLVSALLGIALSLAERYAPKAVRRFIPSPTGVGLGFILPFFYPFAMFLGALAAAIFQYLRPKAAERFVIPISSGLIAGESIMGVLVAGLNNFVFR